MFLRFRVMLDNSGNVTFHANYTGCKDENGIMANKVSAITTNIARVISFFFMIRIPSVF